MSKRKPKPKIKPSPWRCCIYDGIELAECTGVNHGLREWRGVVRCGRCGLVLASGLVDEHSDDEKDEYDNAVRETVAEVLEEAIEAGLVVFELWQYCPQCAETEMPRLKVEFARWRAGYVETTPLWRQRFVVPFERELAMFVGDAFRGLEV